MAGRGPSSGGSPAAPPSTTFAATGCVLDSPARLSHSLLWDWQRSFYSAAGVSAWSSGVVPSFVASNGFTAAAYAKTIMAFIADVHSRYAGRRDSSSSSSSSNAAPVVTIVELGGGTGKFAFLLLQQLWDMRAFWPNAATAASASGGGGDAAHAAPPQPPFLYVLTDVTEQQVSFWRAHPSLAPFVARGLLDFAVVDAAELTSVENIWLHHRCTTLSPRSNANPLCVVANYVVDSLPADAFALIPVQRPAPTSTTSTNSNSSSGSKDDPCRYLQLQESLLSLSSPRRRYEPDLRDPSLIRRARLAWSQRDVPGALFPVQDAAMAAASTQARPASSRTTANAASAPLLNYYSGTDAPFNTLLRDLCMQLAASPEATAGFSLLLPVGFLRCLNSLMRLSHGNLLLLAGDKAHTCAADLAGLRAPHLALHGSFSLMANFLALKRWFLIRGGDAIVTPNAEGFKVGAFATMAWARDNDKEQSHPQPTGVVASVLSAMRGGGIGVVRARSPSPSSPFEHSSDAVAISPSVPFAQALPQTGLAFHQSFLTFSPEHFSTLQRCVADLADQATESQAVVSSAAAELSASPPPSSHEALTGPSLRHVQALLRLAHGDADLFYKFRHVFIEGVAAATAPSPSPSPSPPPPSGAAAIAGGRQSLLSEKALRDLRMDLSLVGASYYPLVLASVPSSSPASLPSGCGAGADASAAFGDDDADDSALSNINRNVNGSNTSVKDIAFELGRAWMALRCYVPEALTCFEASLRDQGEHPVTRFNSGLATYYGAAAAATTTTVAAASAATTTAAAQQQQQQQQQIALLRRSLSEFTQCLAQSPGYAEASEWRQRVETKIKLLQQQPQSPSQPLQQQQHQLQQPPQPQQPPQSLSPARVATAVHANGVHTPSLHNPSSSLPAHLSPSFYAYSSPYL